MRFQLAVLLERIACRAPLIALVWASSLASQSPLPVASQHPSVRQGYVEASDGVRLFYRVVGAGRDTVIVLHGGPGLTMDYLARDLTPLTAHHALLFYDQRGAGRSSLVADSAALDGRRFSEDLETLRQHFGLRRVTLLAHSWGAGVAALYASRYPDRIARLVIVDAIPLRHEELVQFRSDLAARRDSATRRKIASALDAMRANPADTAACRAYYALWFRPFFADPSAPHRSQGDFCADAPESRHNKFVNIDRLVYASLGQWDWRPALRRVHAPALVIHGAEDVLPVAGGREWAAALPDARFVLLPGAGHFPYVEAPEAFFSAVNAFLEGSGSTRASAQDVVNPDTLGFRRVLSFPITDTAAGHTTALGDSLVLRIVQERTAAGGSLGWYLAVEQRSANASRRNLLYHSLGWHGPYPTDVFAWIHQQHYYPDDRTLSVFGWPYDVRVVCRGCAADGEKEAAHFTAGMLEVAVRRLPRANPAPDDSSK